MLLALSAIGAGVSGRQSVSFNLHRAAQRSLWRLVGRSSLLSLSLSLSFSRPANLSTFPDAQLHSCRFNVEGQPIWVVQALLLVMMFGVYSGSEVVIKESLSLHSILATVRTSVCRTVAPDWEH